MRNFIFLVVLLSVTTSEPAFAGQSVATNLSSSNSSSYWSSLRSKIRVRSFSELMTPGVGNSPGYVPGSTGDDLFPSNLWSVVWLDYQISENYRLLYWQRGILDLASSADSQGIKLNPKNPRFGLRRTSVFNVANLDTVYDLYVQPGFAESASGKDFEIGFRTNTTYAFSGSRWSIGAITELNYNISSKPASEGPISSVYGWVMPWVNYDWNQTFSNQHYVTVNVCHDRDDRIGNLSLDVPKPFMQNGVGVNLTQDVAMSVLVNNYLLEAPTLQNTWASVWLSVAWL